MGASGILRVDESFLVTMNARSERNPWEEETFKYDSLHLRIRKCLREVVRLQPKSVLELGCGVGILRNELLRSLPRVAYYGCDVSEEAVRKLNDPNIVRVDLHKEPLPFEGQRFSCVVGSGIFEYIPDLASFLAQVRDRLEENGALVASYYNMTHLYRRIRDLLGLSVSRHSEWRNTLSPSQFTEELEKAGFQVEKWIPVDIRIGKPKVRTRQNALAECLNDWSPLKGLLGSQIVFVCRRK